MFRPVTSKPDFVAQEHELLATWRERRTFARLRAQNEGGPRWSFLDGPITANNPMGVHHAWGRAYKDLYQRFHAMLGEDQRYQNGFDCQGLWVEVNVERDLGFTSKRDIEAYGIDRFVTLCKERVLTYAARQTEQSIRLGMWMDWDDPDELRRLRDALAADPSQVVTVRGPNGPLTDTAEMLVGRLGHPELGGSYYTFSNENNDLIWGFLAECHRRGWLYKGLDSMPWCPRCGTGLSQMEMNEGYQDREDPGLTVRLPLVEPGHEGESLLVWTTTPWTLAANIAAAVGPAMRYLRVRQGDESFWVGRGALRNAVVGTFEVVEERDGSELVGWGYRGPYDDLPEVQRTFQEAGYEHRIVPWTEVGEEEGTGIVHIATGAGAEDFQLGKSIGLPVIVAIDEDGRYHDGFGWLTGLEAPNVTEAIVDDLERRGIFYHLEPYQHRYPHCWRCNTPLLWRAVDEWYISMGPVYDQPREELTKEQVDASLRYQIMEVVDQIRWIPEFGYDRELDWLRNMHDWMISKKRYWGLALPIYDCAECGTVEVIGGREELRQRAVEGWERFEGHTPHRPWVDEVRIACPKCGTPVERIKDVGNPWLDAGIVPFSTIHYREDPEYWRRWFPANFITESFPGQFRNWFYSMLAMSTVLRREPPFKTIFGYATLFGEDGRPMHKSWGNAIDFDEAAERMGVDVMRWMFAKARPEENILFGWHAADEARRELLILWNVYAFFVTYARLVGWTPTQQAPPVPERAVLDRWILSRAAGTAAAVEERLRDVDALGATRALSTYLDELSTWYLRLSRRRFSRSDDAADRAAAFSTLHEALAVTSRMLAPTAEVAAHRDQSLESSMDLAQRTVELARTIRGANRLKTRQPLARAWVAVPGGDGTLSPDLLELVGSEINVKTIEPISDGSELVERRVKVLLPKVGKRLGPAIPAVMAAAREGKVDIRADGSVALAGVELAADEVEIQATPLPGTAVAEDDGLVLVLDTALSDALRAEGDARELARAVQELRRAAGLELDDRIELWVEGLPRAVAEHLPAVAADTLADLATGDIPDDAQRASVALDGGTVTIALRRLD
jgi:isoleucyl-tRNA synthetase